MLVSKYRFIFFNIIIIFLFVTNQFVLCFIFFLMRLPYWLNVESNIEYQFLYFYKDLDGINAGHLDYDTDSEFYYILLQYRYKYYKYFLFYLF